MGINSPRKEESFSLFVQTDQPFISFIQNHAYTIVPANNSQNAPVPYSTMHHSVTKWCIVDYVTGELWDLCNMSIMPLILQAQVGPASSGFFHTLEEIIVIKWLNTLTNFQLQKCTSSSQFSLQFTSYDLAQYLVHVHVLHKNNI